MGQILFLARLLRPSEREKSLGTNSELKQSQTKWWTSAVGQFANEYWWRSRVNVIFFFREDRLSTFYILLLLAIIDWKETHVDCLNKGKHYFIVILYYTPILRVPLDPKDYRFNLKGRLCYFFRRCISDTCCSWIWSRCYLPLSPCLYEKFYLLVR